MTATILLAAVVALGTGASPPSATRAQADRYVPSVSAHGYLGRGAAHRHVAPLVVPDRPGFYRPALDMVLGVAGVPRRAPAIEIGGEIRAHAATTVGVETSTPARPRGRTLGASAWAGLTWWPRAVEHRLGLGADLGHTVAPFVITRGLEGVASYGVHGPAIGARFEGETRRRRVLITGRPYLGVAFPYGLQVAAIDRPAAQVGAVIQTAIRLHGPLYLRFDVVGWNVRLRREGQRPFNDHVITATAGLMLRSRWVRSSGGG